MMQSVIYHEDQYVDSERSDLIKNVKRVMAVSRRLLSMNVINVDTYSQIRRAGTKEKRKRLLHLVLFQGGYGIKSAFQSAVWECDPQILDLPQFYKFSFRESKNSYDWFIDEHRSELIQRVTEVMPVLDELFAQKQINDEIYEQIRSASTLQEQMRELYKALDGGGFQKSALYSALAKYEPHLLFHLENNHQILQYKTFVIDKCRFVTEYNSTSIERVELAARYTEPVIIQRSKEHLEKYYPQHLGPEDASSQVLVNDKNQSIKIDQLFSPDSDGNTPKTVILSGDSGTGKSFMLQKIMLDWASGELYSENFNVVFLLKVDELKCIYEWISLYEILNWSSSFTSSQILELVPEKVLVLIDGLDEFSFEPNIKSFDLPCEVTHKDYKAPVMDTLVKLLNGQILPESFLLVTTGSDTNSVMNLVKGPQRYTEIVGFSEIGVKRYFQSFFQDMQLFRKTYESVTTNQTLLTACSVPLLCWMVCFCLKKHFTDDHIMTKLKTTTSIYVHFIWTLLENQSLSVLTSVGRLAEEGVLDEVSVFDMRVLFETGFECNRFLHTELFLRDSIRKTVQIKFMHLSFQEFFMALYYAFLNEEQRQKNIRDTLVAEKVNGGLSNSISSVLLFLCGISNIDASCYKLEQMYNMSKFNIIRKEMEKTILTILNEDKMLALHCLFELQDDEFTRRALADLKSLDLSNVALRSTDCWVLLYCLQLCPHIRDLDLVYSELPADKLEILQPALSMCENMRKCSKLTEKSTELHWRHRVKGLSAPEELTQLVNLNIFEFKASDLNLHPLPVCQSCVHIADSDQWVEVEPSVCRAEEGPEMRISTPAGRFECSRTRMRWVCAGEVTLQYRAMDGRILNEHLERLQCERIGPVMDVTVISGTLEEAHLPHYACLAESDPSLKNTVKLLSKRDEGKSLQSVELTRFHAKIIQPSFSLTTLIINWLTQWEEHCNLLLFMRRKDPLTLHVYFFPVNDTCLKDKVERDENSSLLIRHPRPNRPFRMKTPHLLEVPGASVHPIEGISFRNDIDPNFFKVRKHRGGDLQMNLIREEDKHSAWTATIGKDEFDELNSRHEEKKQEPSKEAQFVDRNYAVLVQRVSSVLPIADELKNENMIHEEKYAEIIAEQTKQGQMRELFKTLHSGGDEVKKKLYYALREHEPYLFKELGGD